MKPRKFIEIMGVAENLKNSTRHSWTSTGRHESVAEHSWRMTLMAYFIKDEFPDIDINKVIIMSLFHDLGEAFTGDIPTFKKNAKDEDKEAYLLNKWIKSLPAPYNKDVKALFDEMEAQETLEAKVYKALDKMEVLIQHNEADISTWIPLEKTLNLSHGEKEAEISDYLKKLRIEIKKDTESKLDNDLNNKMEKEEKRLDKKEKKKELIV